MVSAIRGRASALVVGALLGSLAGCDQDRTLSPTAEHESPVLPVVASDGVGTASAQFAGGIPIGLFAQPLSEYGARYDGGHRNTPPTSLLSDLVVLSASCCLE